ncbi:MAG: cytochrome-c peroxidase, partial [Acidobacteriota bacterium]|nr:cytochrome-c peroxidase [Acidobacteriota bacterium]
MRNQTMLVALGKALFWDMRVGSDGRTACATCHFHAGADHRSQNQLNNQHGSFAVNRTLKPEDFPFHALSNVNDSNSTVLHDSAAAVGSAGSFPRVFLDLDGEGESGTDASDASAFTVNGVNVRQVGGVNAPSVINAVFNVRNFWNGRASNIFSGLTPFGDSDTRENSLVFENGQLRTEKVRVQNSGLASQAVGPPLNAAEMSYDGRSWPKLGKKMLSLSPLALQRVAPDDSVLGPLANANGPG